jgi:hypothetical protein
MQLSAAIIKSGNGHAITVPEEITVAFRGRPIGRRMVTNERPLDIEEYLSHFNRVVELYRTNRVDEALIESDATLAVAPTLRAKFNRAMVLLAAGRWGEGFDEYWQCEQHEPFMRPQVHKALDAGIPPWKGEDLRGKKLLVMHAHGFGDTIMMLRYVQQLWEMGANVRLDVPEELRRLADPFAPVGIILEKMPDYFCPILHLLHFLQVTPDSVDRGPYIALNGQLEMSTRVRLGPAQRRRVGIAWSIGKPSDGDYPRAIPLAELVAALGDAEIHSVQTQNADEARALGVHVHGFTDFAECAALMLQMDQIISVDTAALHLAGAIGHPDVVGLLSHWSSWRWLTPWYYGVKLCRQTSPGDWSSALAQLRR